MDRTLTYTVGDLASDAAVQALIDISGLIRALPSRTRTHAADYINRTYLREAQESLRGAA